MLAERLGLSPILTMVVYAMTLVRSTPAYLPARLRMPSYAVWETAVLVLHVLAFLVIGLELGPIIAAARPGELGRRGAIKRGRLGRGEQGLDLGAERGLVGLDGQQVVGAGASDRAGEGSVGGDGVDRDQRALEPIVLGQALDQGRDGGGLTRL